MVVGEGRKRKWGNNGWEREGVNRQVYGESEC